MGYNLWLHHLYGEQGISIFPRQPQEEDDSQKIKTTSSSKYSDQFYWPVFIPTSVFYVQEDSNKVDEDALIYDSYDSKEGKIVEYFQKDSVTSKWGEYYQQQLLQEEPKFEEKNSVCGYLLQKYSCIETVQEREVGVNFSH